MAVVGACGVDVDEAGVGDLAMGVYCLAVVASRGVEVLADLGYLPPGDEDVPDAQFVGGVDLGSSDELDMVSGTHML